MAICGLVGASTLAVGGLARAVDLFHHSLFWSMAVLDASVLTQLRRELGYRLAVLQ